MNSGSVQFIMTQCLALVSDLHQVPLAQLLMKVVQDGFSGYSLVQESVVSFKLLSSFLVFFRDLSLEGSCGEKEE